MQKVYNSVLEMIGHTPIVRLNWVTKPTEHEFFAKLECFNPGQSVKDRIAVALIEGAEARGELKSGGTIIEATSGNTGLGLALVAATKGYLCIFVMPDKISQEKRDILKAFGAKVVITPSGVEPEDPRSYLSVSRKIAQKTKNSFYVNQYHNPDNPNQHYKTTGPEIWDQMDGKLDAFVGGAGTGGTVSGVGRYLREKNKDMRIVCADPVGSILYDLFYHKKIIDPPKPYKVEGVGEDMLPENVHLNVTTDFERVTDQDSFDMTRRLIAEEGLCVGPSSAMALVGAIQFSKKLTKPSKILVIFPDHGRAYLSKAFNDKWLGENGLTGSLKMSAFAEIVDSESYYRKMGYHFDS
ncbi:MAG: cysteine synthase family protein [Bdellovibrionaceae bacterium]|nr:cysteine synthase family protein [Pseudobdellovibrionaceae bacterium]